MKYLKRFNNISEAVSETYIKDVLLDLTDEGFKYKISWSGDPVPGKMNKKGMLTSFASYPYLKIDITRSDKFTYNDVKDSVDRLSGYLESEGYTRLNNMGRFFNYPSDFISNIQVEYKFSTLGLMRAKSKFAI
jgi:hypothetical protein